MIWFSPFFSLRRRLCHPDSIGRQIAQPRKAVSVCNRDMVKVAGVQTPNPKQYKKHHNQNTDETNQKHPTNKPTTKPLRNLPSKKLARNLGTCTFNMQMKQSGYLVPESTHCPLKRSRSPHNSTSRITPHHSKFPIHCRPQAPHLVIDACSKIKQWSHFASGKTTLLFPPPWLR